MRDEQIEAAMNAYERIIDACHETHRDLRVNKLLAMEHALAAAERAAWQPIKTAPKDGTPVDLWLRRRG